VITRGSLIDGVESMYSANEPLLTLLDVWYTHKYYNYTFEGSFFPIGRSCVGLGSRSNDGWLVGGWPYR
jgi:hypothetical protein